MAASQSLVSHAAAAGAHIMQVGVLSDLEPYFTPVKFLL